MIDQITMEVTILLDLYQLPSCIGSQTSIHYGSRRLNIVYVLDLS